MINDKLNTSIEPATERQVKYLQDISNVINSDWFVANKQIIVDEFKLAGVIKGVEFGVLKNYKSITAKYLASNVIKHVKLSPTFYKRLQDQNPSSTKFLKIDDIFKK